MVALVVILDRKGPHELAAAPSSLDSLNMLNTWFGSLVETLGAFNDGSVATSLAEEEGSSKHIVHNGVANSGDGSYVIVKAHMFLNSHTQADVVEGSLLPADNIDNSAVLECQVVAASYNYADSSHELIVSDLPLFSSFGVLRHYECSDGGSDVSNSHMLLREQWKDSFKVRVHSFEKKSYVGTLGAESLLLLTLSKKSTASLRIHQLLSLL